MNRLVQLHALRNRVDQEIAREQRRARDIARLRDSIPPALDEHPERITLAVAELYGITTTDLYSRRTGHPLPDARAIICWIGRAEGLTYDQCAHLLGRDSGGSVGTAVDKVDSNPYLLRQARDLHHRLTTPYATRAEEVAS